MMFNAEAEGGQQPTTGGRFGDLGQDLLALQQDLL